jgi:hypothetical protein
LGAFFVGADEVLIGFNGSREPFIMATPCREFSFTRNGRNPSSAIEITAEKIDYKHELKAYFFCKVLIFYKINVILITKIN